MRGISKKSIRRRRARRQALQDVGAADALALGDGEAREGEHGRGLAPLGQAVGHVAADDEGQVVLR